MSVAVTAIPARPAATAEAYDAVAVRYAGFVRAAPVHPLERAVLAAFAECVAGAGGGLVADLGCGPGLMTARLRDLGLDVFGVDLSTAMIGLARDAYPGLRFDGRCLRWTRWTSPIRPVLTPGGHLLAAFFETAPGRRRSSITRWPRRSGGRSMTSPRWRGRRDSPRLAGCHESPARTSGSAAGTC